MQNNANLGKIKKQVLDEQKTHSSKAIENATKEQEKVNRQKNREIEKAQDELRKCPHCKQGTLEATDIPQGDGTIETVLGCDECQYKESASED